MNKLDINNSFKHLLYSIVKLKILKIIRLHFTNTFFIVWTNEQIKHRSSKIYNETKYPTI